jgi:hypothetical protein
MNYEERDPYGMYKTSSTGKAGPDARHGPGPTLMGAEMLVGNEVYNRDCEDLGEIKEIMLDSAPGFDKTHWLDMADATWEKGIHAYYGTKPHGDQPRA